MNLTFKDYLTKSLNAPKIEATKIADSIKENFKLMENEDDVMSMAEMIVQICGEKSGEWIKGSELLKKLKNNAPVKDKEQKKRLAAILNLGNNPNISIDEFSTADQIIIYTKTAEALKRLGGLKNAEKLLARASALQV